ncbi:MAG: hypothetical protein L6461_02225 [Anaerolineae bacterium]|nr:hypothetical protein [Anaerolineae bacterium]
MKQTQHFAGNVFQRGRGILRALFACAAVFSLLAGSVNPGSAEGDPRVLHEQVTVQSSHWQLLRWNDGSVVCNIYVDHASQPSIDDVNFSCGSKVSQTWLSTPACSPAQYGASSSNCTGLMLRYLGGQTRTETKVVELPEITMRLYLTDCLPGQWCENRPGLRLIAEEPVDGHQITNIYVRVVDNEKAFNGPVSELKLPPTGEKGEWLEYWAESDFGDRSQRFQVKYRSYSGVQDGRQVYRFDLLTEEWASSLPGGALLWQMFPPADGSLPKLFEQPLAPGYLATTNRYALLAGNLIRNGLVDDAASCSDRGVLQNGAASVCGERAAAEAVLTWQNKYDAQIYAAGLRYNVPARIIKGVIAQESQFWPESSDPYERGLGYITEKGVSMLLLWNLDYYAEACLPIYGRAGCAAGYTSMREDRQITLRRAVFDRIGSESEIDLIAAMLYASAAQTQQMVKNVTRAEPAEASTYEDMWMMTIANYYAGSGCLGNALNASLNETYPLKWQTLAGYLEETCAIADAYVDRVINYSD